MQDWQSLSEITFGLVLSGKLDTTQFQAVNFFEPYHRGFTAWKESGSKTKVIETVSDSHYNTALEAATAVSSVDVEEIDWAERLRYAANAYKLGVETGKLSKKLIKGERIELSEATELGASFKDLANPKNVGLTQSNELDLDSEEDIIESGYLPIDTHLGGIPASGNILVMGTTGIGKCHAKGTKILMFDGTTLPVEQIRVGDYVMGQDSLPRKVLSLAHGYDNMYDIVPVKGDKYTVNSEHILSLKLSATVNSQAKAGDVINIRVKDYLKQGRNFKHLAKGWRTGVDFVGFSRDLPVDPYFIGIWLADGSAGEVAITTNDQEVIDYVHGVASDWGLHVRFDNKFGYHMCGTYEKNNTSLRDVMRNLGIMNNKHIPFEYKTASRQDRLELLAGILDGDGCLTSGCFDIVQKSETLANDILFLARSLGFAAYVSPCEKYCQTSNGGIYYRITISGDLSVIPFKVARRVPQKRKQIKSHLVTGISVVPVGYGEYFGFNLDGDGLYLLEDFTVTHNSLWSQVFLGGFLNKYQDKKAAVFSLEMTSGQYIRRGLQLYPKFKKAHERGQVFVSDRSTTIDTVGFEVAAGGYDIVVVDYIEYLIKGEGSETKYAEIYKNMNDISRDLKIPFVMLLQPNREAYKGGVPKMWHARWSGMAENVAAQFWILYSPKSDEDTNGDYVYVDNSMYLICEKSRFGWLADGRIAPDGKDRRGPGAIVLPKVRTVWAEDEAGEWLKHGDVQHTMTKGKRKRGED